MTTELLGAALAAAEAGAVVLRRYFRTADLEVRKKAENDFVTRADGESEAAIVGLLRERFPDHHVLAEERGIDAGGASEFEWVIDPLDGTTNFLQGLPVYCISIACRRRSGELLAGVVLDPEGGNRFAAAAGRGATWNDRPMRSSARPGLAGAFLATGYPWRAHPTLDLYLEAFRDIFLEVRAIRRCGAAALDLADTAAGVYDGFFEFRLSPWDIAAGILLVREAGGVVTDVDGGQGSFVSGNVVAGGPAVQPELLAKIARHATEAGIAERLRADQRADQRADRRSETPEGKS
jgi:myo-inositol-1(or 4)-monophosphatase